MKNEFIEQDANPQRSSHDEESSQPITSERTKNLLIMDEILRSNKPIITEPNFKQKVFTAKKDDFSGKKSPPKGSKFCWSKCYCCPFGIWSWKC